MEKHLQRKTTNIEREVSILRRMYLTGDMILRSLIIILLLAGCSAANTKTESPEAIRKQFVHRMDEFNGNKYSMHEHFLVSTADVPIKLYLVNDSSLRFKVNYIGDDWIFFNKITMLNSSGIRIRYPVNTIKKKMDVKRGFINETYDFVLTDEYAKSLLTLLQKEGLIKVRLRGHDYSDFTLSHKQVDALVKTLKLYFNRNSKIK